MPELPEVETVRRGLELALAGAVVRTAELRRADVCTGGASPEALLLGDRLARFTRLGKQLALHGASGRVLVVHLGMSGQLLAGAPGSAGAGDTSHVHARWGLERAGAPLELRFRDPRRFGGLWTLPDEDALAALWRPLGPDALDPPQGRLAGAFAGTRRSVKSVLLDQRVLAGLGNIYADEALFAAGVHPLRAARSLRPREIEAVEASIRRVLREAVASRGSTLRDYRDATGSPGAAQLRHLVYGRAGQACVRCGRTLARLVVSQRTTVACPTCQPRRRRGT